MNNITGAPVTGSDFFPRERELDWIWERLPHSSLLLAAPRRSGKTSLMFALRDQPRFGYHPLFFNVESDAHPAAFVAHMVDQLRSLKGISILQKRLAYLFQTLLPDKVKLSVETAPVKVELEKALRHTDGWEAEGRRLQEALRALPIGESIVFLVDEFPLLLQRVRQHKEDGPALTERFLHWFRSVRTDPDLVDGRVRFLVTGSIGVEGVVRRLGLSATLNDLDRVSLEPFALEQGLKLLTCLHTTAAAGNTRLPAVDQMGSLFDAMLHRLEELSPYYIQLFYKELRELALFGGLPITEGLVDRVYRERMLGASGRRALSHYNERLDQALPREEADIARRMLDMASERQGGLSEKRIFDRLANEGTGEPELADSLLRILLHDGYLKREGSRVRFRSRLLRDWWRGERVAVLRARRRRDSP